MRRRADVCGRPNTLRPVRTPFHAKLVLTNFSERLNELRHQLVGLSNIYVCASVFLNTRCNDHVILVDAAQVSDMYVAVHLLGCECRFSE
jgi:hypothetical protein